MVDFVAPQSVEELQRIFSESSETNRPIYAYSKSRNRKTADNRLEVELSKLDRIIEIDTANLVATVEPGVKLLKLSQELVQRGLRFIPADTPFYHDKTIGQLFYEGCSNISSLKYGITKHFLMGSEVVLPTGEILKTGGKTVKNVTGYDVTRFFNSPYTDYGVTAKFLLKLLPLPKTRKSLAVTFLNLEKLTAFVKDLKDARIVPAYLLWVDANVQNIFEEKKEDTTAHLVMTEFDGLDEETSEQYHKTDFFIKKYDGTIIETSDDCTQTAIDWSRLYRPNNKCVLTDEFKMAFTGQENFITSFYHLSQKEAVKAGLFGQLAEGKINIAFDAPSYNEGFIGELMKMSAAAGAISSGKYNRITGKNNNNETLANLEQRVKLAFDPNLVLNR